ncbi:MAG: ADP-dependent glucokinase/phosphofructokinase [Candidatus Undinarchaeales archaeon]|jgi:hypothetical protein|nr:ADP-dependent glucokinase/phosphofructokinase [Candidatus Undinarchaeales archaeon]MDP7491440.1 ADP-dependent glucokinase/phosphofructokinase [Candidatus Undinarchaeales archaeon]
MEALYVQQFADTRKHLETSTRIIPTMVVGCESTRDVWINFSSLDEIKRFSNRYEGKLKPYLDLAHMWISKGKGDERVIDGNSQEADELIRELRDRGVKIKNSLGGNGALESSALKALGANVVFVGNIFPKVLKRLPNRSKKYFEFVDFDFAITLDELDPKSLIIQAGGTDRFILCDGEGRRWEHLRDYVDSIPNIVEEVSETYGIIDSVNLVGWHVVFATDKNGLDKVSDLVDKVRGNTRFLFTDTGALTKTSNMDRKFLFEKVYDKFDVLSVNEIELEQLHEALFPRKGDQVTQMADILGAAKNLKAIWLHTRTHHVCVKKKDFLTLDTIIKAQNFAAIAGVLRVETGRYPRMDEMIDRFNTLNFSEEGISAAEKIVEQYGAESKDGTFTVGGMEGSIVPGLECLDFESEVGAGDASSSAFTYMLSVLGRKSGV